jgi:hypothetical protein
MEEWSNVPVPRNLRVRATINVWGNRISVRLFAVGVVLVVIWTLMAFGGADLFATASWLGGIGVIAGVLLEGRWAGLTTFQIAHQVLKRQRGPRYLSMSPLQIALEAEQPVRAGRRAPRWATAQPAPLRDV